MRPVNTRNNTSSHTHSHVTRKMANMCKFNPSRHVIVATNKLQDGDAQIATMTVHRAGFIVAVDQDTDEKPTLYDATKHVTMFVENVQDNQLEIVNIDSVEEHLVVIRQASKANPDDNIISGSFSVGGVDFTSNRQPSCPSPIAQDDEISAPQINSDVAVSCIQAMQSPLHKEATSNETLRDDRHDTPKSNTTRSSNTGLKGNRPSPIITPYDETGNVSPSEMSDHMQIDNEVSSPTVLEDELEEAIKELDDAADLEDEYEHASKKKKVDVPRITVKDKGVVRRDKTMRVAMEIVKDLDLKDFYGVHVKPGGGKNLAYNAPLQEDIRNMHKYTLAEDGIPFKSMIFRSVTDMLKHCSVVANYDILTALESDPEARFAKHVLNLPTDYFT